MQTFLLETTYVPAPVPFPAPKHPELLNKGRAEAPVPSTEETLLIEKTASMPALPKTDDVPRSVPAGSVRKAATYDIDTMPKGRAPAKASVEKAKPAPRPEASQPRADTAVERSSPALPPALSDAEKIESRPIPRRSSEKRVATPSTGNRIALVAVGFGLLMILMGGVGLAAWKIASGPKAPDDPGDKSVIVANSDGGNPKPGGPEQPTTPPEGPAFNQDPPAVNTNVKPTLPTEGDDEETRKAGDEDKKLLTRKTQAKGKAIDVAWDDIGNVNVAKQPLWGVDQQKINQAIDKGVFFLKSTQNANGTWHSGHPVGHAAIGGLTLLECHVPAHDPFVQRAAFFVRSNVANLNQTYELSLAILFLDRLGDPRDRALIQGMALRLLAGQLDGGGWTYTCRLLDPQEMYQLYSYLQANKKPSFFNPLQGGQKLPAGLTGTMPLTNPLGGDPSKLNDPFNQLNDLILTKAIEGPATPMKPATGGVIAPVNPNGAGNPAIDPKKFDPLKPTKAPKGKQMPFARQEWLKPALQNLPAVQNQGKGKGQMAGKGGGGDNSNTQFALLALWAARRHDIPTDHALLAGYQRFLHSQNGDGGWGYHVRGGSTPSMTCVGLLGEAMGHGTAPEIIHVNPNNPKDVIIKPALQDPVIQNGLKALARTIGEPSLTQKSFAMPNLYYLWSVERVAMLYDLKTIGGKDWYGWGAQILVHTQRVDGAWVNSQYPGQNPSTNTCLALLFLKRSNLVKDLTSNLRLQSAITNP